MKIEQSKLNEYLKKFTVQCALYVGIITGIFLTKYFKP